MGEVHGPQLFRPKCCGEEGWISRSAEGSENAVDLERRHRGGGGGAAGFTLDIILQFYRERPCFRVLNFTRGVCTSSLMLFPFPLRFTRFLARHKLPRHNFQQGEIVLPTSGTQFASTRLASVDD